MQAGRGFILFSIGKPTAIAALIEWRCEKVYLPVMNKMLLYNIRKKDKPVFNWFVLFVAPFGNID
jgi:hypothetical protein